LYQLDIPFRPLLGRIKRAVLPPHRVPSALEDRLLFRFGFAFHAAADHPRAGPLWTRLAQRWRRIGIGEFVLLAHPETRVATIGDGDRFTVLIGHAFFATGTVDGTPVEALAAADGDALLDLLDRLGGSFALIVRRGGKTGVYQDAYGSRAVFYRQGGAFGIASHAEIFAHLFGDRRRPEMMDLVESEWFRTMKRAYLPTDATLFAGVYALLPNHRYDVDRRRTERFWPRHRRSSGASFDAFFTRFDEYFRRLADHVRDRRLIVAVTGGIDSRTLIAALRHNQVSFRTVTWTSFNFAEWERQPVRNVVDYLGGDHYWVDRNTARINDAAEIGSRNSGNYRGPSPAVAGMTRLFGRDARSFWLPGIGAGVIRSTAEVAALTPDAILDYFLLHTDVSRFHHRNFVVGEIESMLDRLDFEQPVRLGYRPGDIFNWEHQAGTWGACSINAMQTAVDCMFGFNSRAVADLAMALPDDVRCTKALFHDVIARYDPRLAAVHYQ
jgi:hypothetical protein